MKKETNINIKNSNKVGVLKKNIIKKDPIHIAKKLFNNKMLNTCSFLDKIFIQIISSPIIIAPNRQRKATGSTF